MRPIRSLPVLVGISLLLTATSVQGQVSPEMTREPAEASFRYDDLTRFLEAFGRLATATDSAATLDTLYLSRASTGLRTYAGMYGLDAGSLATEMAERPDRYRRVARAVPGEIMALEPEIRGHYRELREHYPGAVFPPVYYLVAHHRAGGAVQREGILIAVEVYASRPGPADSLSNTLGDLPHLVIHELVHFQQAASDLENYQRSNSVLARAIKEGSADFIAELVSGRHINLRAHRYGLRHENELWKAFRCDLQETETGDWFFRGSEDGDRPADLGYFIGYRIARSYYERAPDPRTAVADIIRVKDYEAFLEDSGYEDGLEASMEGGFPPCS